MSLRLKDHLGDVQGIVVRGYGKLPSASFLLLEIREPSAARRWLETLDVTRGDRDPVDRALNVALTHAGLAAIGLPPKALDQFSDEFSEGMAADPRPRVLGDLGRSAPERWEWGGPTTARIHLLLLAYATTPEALDAMVAGLQAGFAAGGVAQVGRTLPTRVLLDEATGCVREHFGFCDAISQPFIEGLEKPAPDFLTVRTGEFILGYPNEYGKLTERPLVDAAQDPSRILPEDPGGSGNRDLGLHGTYLVFRHLEQDPCGFWKFMEGATQDENGVSTPEARVRLAAKMVGRWPSGAPLTLAPDGDRPDLRAFNGFLYHKDDPGGLRCPVGAHVRRTNPRDSLPPHPGSPRSIAVNKRHQLLRRGRSYGAPVASSMDPEDIRCGDPAGERGIFFICLNGNISRQFEFVQRSWVNNPKFAGLYDDPDPLIGHRELPDSRRSAVFTEPAEPVRRRVAALPEFVTVRGGGYFFVPSRSGLRYLASLGS